MLRISNSVFKAAAIVTAAMLVLSACGSSGGGEAAPAATLKSIAVTPATSSIVAGHTQQYMALGTYSDATTKDITSSVVWTSGTTARATIVSNTGLATGVAVGYSTITAKLGSISGSATLTVSPATLVSVAVAPVNPYLVVNATQQFYLIGTYSDASTQALTATWASSDTLKAIIGASSGLATASATLLGPTTITGTSGTWSASTVLTVATSSSHTVSLTWNANHEKGVNSAGGGYTITFAGYVVHAPVNVPWTSGATAPTSTSVALTTGTYTATVSGYAALDASGGATGSNSAASSSIYIVVP